MTITLCSHNSLVIVPFVASFGRRRRVIVLIAQYCRVYSAQDVNNLSMVFIGRKSLSGFRGSGTKSCFK